MLLDSLLAGELSDMNSKMRFWKIDTVDRGSLWEDSGCLDLQAYLLSLPMDDPEIQGPGRFSDLYCLAWEFVWGKCPPEFVSQRRKKLLDDANGGQPLSELENLWLQIIAVDTDYF